MQTSKAIDFNDSIGKGLRRFLWQIVPDTAGDEPMRILARELLGVGSGVWVWRAIGVAFESDCRDRNDGGLGEPLFQTVVCGLAIGQSETPAVIVDHDVDMIWVVERCCGALESGIVETPLR